VYQESSVRAGGILTVCRSQRCDGKFVMPSFNVITLSRVQMGTLNVKSIVGKLGSTFVWPEKGFELTRVGGRSQQTNKLARL